jgi:hypothetical protein
MPLGHFMEKAANVVRFYCNKFKHLGYVTCVIYRACCVDIGTFEV